LVLPPDGKEAAAAMDKVVTSLTTTADAVAGRLS
jgi:hypothetical protein